MHINRFLRRHPCLNHRLFAHSIVPAITVLCLFTSVALAPTARADASWPAELGLPRSSDLDIRLIENDGFVIGYDAARGRAAWVAYRLTAVVDYVNRPRPPFIDDPRINTVTDTHVYAGPAYDRGHLAPNYAMSQLYGEKAQRQSSYYSNVVPQRPRLNQLLWQRLEEVEIDDVAPAHSPLWVLVGPIAADNERSTDPWGEQDKASRTPAAFFRIWVARDDHGRWQAMAFVVPQAVRGDEPLDEFVVAIATIEARTGLELFPALAATARARMESSPAPRSRFGLQALACNPARYAARWRDRGPIRLNFDRCEVH
ncbi:DNA/RNA non-specific endonuclease [Salinisphaera sp. C84B14]|uniref:DNA/RNA non-specific endonuclease n=1 Tax=Salinisphaera sp. C84B14 TaxID=1304155 RepID=UPI0033429902